jgi:hypothetical protein
VISVAVRWYLRYELSYRDVEELLAERGSIRHLRDDLDRFIFLLGGSDGEHFLTGSHDEPNGRRPHDN